MKISSEPKKEVKKVDPLMKEIQKLKKDFLNAEDKHKVIEENLKKNIEDLTAEAAKFKLDYEKTSEQLQNHKKQISDMGEKEALITQEALVLNAEL